MSFELNRRHGVERLVNSAVVEPVDVVERGPFDVFDVAPGTLAVKKLGLIETVERFSEGFDGRIQGVSAATSASFSLNIILRGPQLVSHFQ